VNIPLATINLVLPFTTAEYILYPLYSYSWWGYAFWVFI